MNNEGEKLRIFLGVVVGVQQQQSHRTGLAGLAGHTAVLASTVAM